MAFFYLVLIFVGSGYGSTALTTLPEPYPTKEACEAAYVATGFPEGGLFSQGLGWGHHCVPAPEPVATEKKP